MDSGQAALERGDWEDARHCFTEALADQESAEAHSGLAKALWFLNELEPSLAHHRRAYALFRARGDLRAVRIACWVAIEHAIIYGDISVARGWFARAGELVEDGTPSVALGWFQLLRAAFEEDPVALHTAATGAIELGRRFADIDLEVTSRLILGQSIVVQGRVAEGMALVEQAMAAVVAGELADPLAVADCFCFMLGTCEYTGDYDLAQQWVRTAAGYLERRSCPFLAAQCRTTYAGVLIAVGKWAEAEEQLLGALRIYDAGHRGMGPQVAARLADLRVRQGALEEAEDLLSGLEHLPAATLPLARMHLVRGDTGGSVALVETLLPGNELTVSHSPAAQLAVEAYLAEGATGKAEELVGRLAEVAEQAGSRVLQAEAALWRGRVAAAGGKIAVAEAALATAAAACPYPDSPLAGRIRLEQARLLAPDSPAAAIQHARAALACFRALDATAEVDAALSLLRALGSPTRVASPRGVAVGDLTRREREVLALVGEGLSNPQIASRLYVSPRTVEHHVGHLFDKLGVSSRAALAAYAAKHRAEIGEHPDVQAGGAAGHFP